MDWSLTVGMLVAFVSSLRQREQRAYESTVGSPLGFPRSCSFSSGADISFCARYLHRVEYFIYGRK